MILGKKWKFLEIFFGVSLGFFREHIKNEYNKILLGFRRGSWGFLVGRADSPRSLGKKE
jgi:hypothetical protein